VGYGGGRASSSSLGEKAVRKGWAASQQSASQPASNRASDLATIVHTHTRTHTIYARKRPPALPPAYLYIYETATKESAYYRELIDRVRAVATGFNAPPPVALYALAAERHIMRRPPKV